MLVASTTHAQDKMLTMKDAIVGYHLYPRGVSQLHWADDNHYAFKDTLDNGDDVMKLVEMHATNNGLTKLITKQDIDQALVKIEADTLKKLPRSTWNSDNGFRFYHNKMYYSYNVGDRTVKNILEYNPGKMQHADINWTSNTIAYVKDDNLWVDKHQVTTDGGNGLVYGQAVHRSEFGITNGTFWMENGDKLAFYRMDESMVTEYPLYNLNDIPATSTRIRYPVAGDTSHHVTVGIFNTKTNETIYLKTGEPKEQYLTNVSWGPLGNFVYIAVVNRAQNHMWLNQYDAHTGDFVKTLFEETNDKYVEPEHGLTFLKSQPDQFVWWSERDGYNHLYLYNTDGDMIRQLTKGEWVVTTFHGFSANEKWLYITSTKESPINRDLYAVSFKKSKKIHKLTSNEGSHRVTGSPNNVHFIDNFSSTIIPREVRIITSEGNNLATLKSVKNPLSEYQLGRMNIGTLTANDGTELYYRIIKPIDFNPKKKYPVLVYLYNGPHAQLINNTWLGGANLWYHFMAQNGFVVFTIDGRGSANRGFDFESAIHRQVGTLEMEDQLTGARWLKNQSWVDSTRMGIHGWSYGGFMTTSMMTRQPGTFQVGVAGGPVIDWRYYEIMYGERYMDTPEENPEGYKNNNLLNYVDSLEGKLLMIHGGQDNVVLWQHSLLYLKKNIKSGNTNLDYFVYPHHPHNVGGMDRVHLYQKVTDYFMLHLK